MSRNSVKYIVSKFRYILGTADDGSDGEAIREGSLSYARHAGGDAYRGEVEAMREGPLSYARHAVCLTASGDSGGDDYITGVFTIA